MKNRRRLTGKEILILCAFFAGVIGATSATLDWQSLGSTLIFVFGIGLPVLIVIAYLIGVKIDKEKH